MSQCWFANFPRRDSCLCLPYSPPIKTQTYLQLKVVPGLTHATVKDVDKISAQKNLEFNVGVRKKVSVQINKTTYILRRPVKGADNVGIRKLTGMRGLLWMRRSQLFFCKTWIFFFSLWEFLKDLFFFFSDAENFMGLYLIY